MIAFLLKKRALSIATKRRAPETIPLTGEAALKNDFFSVYLISKDESFGLLVDGVCREGVFGRVFDGEKYENLCSVEWKDVADLECNFRHFYKGYEFVEESPLKFVVNKVLRIYRAFIAKERIEQLIFNRKTLVRHQRFQVIKNLTEQYLSSANRDVRFNPFSYLKMLHGNRWVFHPEKDRIIRYYSFLFDSLVESGELIKRDVLAYQLKEKALVTLAGFEEEERKHRDAIGQQRKIVYLTVVLVLIGAAQVYVQYTAQQSASSTSPKQP